MKVRISALAVPVLGLLAACSTNTVRGSAPAPASALACAQSSLESMGFTTREAARDNGFSARRKAGDRYLYRIDHVVQVSAPERGKLELVGRRVEVREVGNAIPTGQLEAEPLGTTRRLDVDDTLRGEVAYVIQHCGAGPEFTTGAAR